MQEPTIHEYVPPGLNIFLLGESGTGKTHSLRTLIPSGVTPFIIFTEKGMLTAGDEPDSSCHWHYIPPADPEWDILEKNAKMISTMSYESLTQLKTGMNKQGYTQWLDIMTTMNDFVCDRCGVHFGGVQNWNTDRAIVIDSLSGLNTMSMDLVIGGKPVKHQGEWGVAMDNLERLIQKMIGGTQCHFILTSHLDSSTDLFSGRRVLTASALGQKLAPKLPPLFDDVILCRQDTSGWYWSTATDGVVLKSRSLPRSDKLTPDFTPIIQGWLAKGGEIKPTAPSET